MEPKVKQRLDCVSAWASQRPDTVSVSVRETAYEYLVDITPRNPRACPLQFQFGNKGSMGFSAHDLLTVDDHDATLEEIVAVCDAVHAGAIEATEFLWRGIRVRTKCKIKTSLRDFYDTRIGSLGLVVRGTPMTLEYEPYSRHS